MESIKGHPEHVETVFGEAIVARDESLVVLANASGLGPPDLCWLQKAPKSALTGTSGEAKGYYHCCLGVDASSSAAVAAYFATLTSLVEPPTFLQGLFSTSEVRVERGFYCCYDPLTRLDVRCELCIPGGVVCGALDCEGNVHDVTSELWRNCVVASFLRAELYDAELVSYSPVPVARIPPLPSPADESRLLAAVTGLYEDGVLPEALDALTVDQSGGVSPEHSDVVLHTLLHYFAKRQRWGTALDFFVRLASTYPTAALYVAAVQRECGLYDDALTTLYRAVGEFPDDAVLLAGLATECLYAEQVDAALRLATKSARLRPSLRPAWLALARALVRQNVVAGGGSGSSGGAAALVVLNLVPPPPVPGKEAAMLHVVVPPDPKTITKPIVPPYDLDVVAVRQMLAEETFVNAAGAAAAGAAGTPAAPLLPGCLLVPREPPDSGAAPDTAPLRITKAVMAAVYTVLQELVAVSGWDGFLRLRSSVFVMHADSDFLREQQREAEERERQLQLLHRQLSATLPPSPTWAAPQPSQQPAESQPPQPHPAANRKGAPEGVDFHAALDEAALMGLAEYPEHLEEGSADPRVAAAREAHRRHLREIAERQARLEAAEGGAYADDEWDGSSGDSGGEGGGGGGPRSSTGRSRRSRPRGRRTTGGKHLRNAQTGPAVTQQMPVRMGVDPRVGGAPDGDADGRLGAVAPVAAVSADTLVLPPPPQPKQQQQQQPPPQLGSGTFESGVVDAGEMARQEALLSGQSGAREATPSESQPLSEKQQQQQQEEGQGHEGQGLQQQGRGKGDALQPAASAGGPAAQSSTSTGWWGALFGGGGSGGAGGGGGSGGAAVASAVQRREARPLGEAVEQRSSSCSGAAWASLAQAGPGAGAPRARCSTAGSAACALVSAERLCPGGRRDSGAQSVRSGEGSGFLWWEPAAARTAAAGAGGAGPAAGRSWVVCTELTALVPRSRTVARGGGGGGCVAPPGTGTVVRGGGGRTGPDNGTTGGSPRSGCVGCRDAGAVHVASATTKLASSFSYSTAVSKVAVAAGLLRRVACWTSHGIGSLHTGGCSTSRQTHRLQRRCWQLWRRHSRLAAPPHPLLALPYGPRTPLLTAPRCASDVSFGARLRRTVAVGSGAALAVRTATAVAEPLHGPPGGPPVRPVVQHMCSPGPVAESGGDAVAPGAAARDTTQDPAAAEPSAFSTATAAAAAAVESAEYGAAAPDADAGVAGADVAAAATGAGTAAREDDRFPLMLQNLESDRQMVLEGLDVMEMDAKRLCARWLDELIVALWHDLQAFLDWKALDSELAEAGFRSHSEIVAGVAPPPTADDYKRAAAAATAPAATAAASAGAPAPAVPRLPSISCVEWLRRGLLAERLHHEADALAAYQAAVMTPPPSAAAFAGGGGAALFAALPGGGPGAFSMTAWQAIMRLAPAADPRDIPWALRAAHAVMTWLDTRGAASFGTAASAAAAVPFTTGFVAALASGMAAGAAAGVAGARVQPAGGKLKACPLPVVHCLHLVAAVLGETGVETALAAAQQRPVDAKSGTGGGPAVAATAAVPVAAAPLPPVHPAAAAVLRHAVRTAATRSGTVVGGASGGELYENDVVSGPLAGAGLVSAIPLRTTHLVSATAATAASGNVPPVSGCGAAA